jgi:hypothetical protein
VNFPEHCYDLRGGAKINEVHFGIRVWAEYGMTAAQVAAVYGVAVGVIERILRQT